MYKVMTRTQRRPAGRPPIHQEPLGPARTAPEAGTAPGALTARRPGEGPSSRGGGTPPRGPGRTGRGTAAGGRPPGPSAQRPRSRTRPTDTRPPTGPDKRPPASRTAPAAPAAPRATAPAACHPVTGSAAPAPVVPAQTPRRPVPPPQPRPTDVFAERLLAVLCGQRPVHSMLRHTVGRAYDELAWLAERGPLRTRGARPVVRDVGYFAPRPGALEVFVRIGAGDRLRAMAFRLERGRDLRWRCSAVELGGPRMPHVDDD
ncbi:Rv3235 family protein [Streptomyces sp. HMX87]|uniref:Rv3235 family protein n=1 Tax=Streptomyces sp. HMX87 TaxID=3390849 RepID=UPI003A89C428